MASPYTESRVPDDSASPLGDPSLLLAEPDDRAISRTQNPGRLALTIALGSALALALAYSVSMYVESLAYESTDDAFIKGRIIYLSPKIAGHVSNLHVSDNQEVKKGQLLAEIDPRDYEVALERAKAALAAAKARYDQANLALTSIKVTSTADLDQAQEGVKVSREGKAEQSALLAAARAEEERAEAQLRRLQRMEKDRLVSREQLDAAQAAARVASANVNATERRMVSTHAQIAQAEAKMRSATTAPLQIERGSALVAQYQAEVELCKAEVVQAELNLSHTRIHAPESGRVAKKSIEPGSYVQPGTALLALVSDDVWVEANFKETQLTDMRPGQPVTLRVDAFPNERHQGRVESFHPGTGSQFSLLPPENATGNFVKTVQRVPVKIVFDSVSGDRRRLLPGLSVVPTVKVR
jgi:membrane fusion protein (multidrug efflux system)